MSWGGEGLDPGFQVRAGTYQFTCVVTETITTELVTRHQAGLCPPTKREKNTREIKYCPGGAQRCSTKWASYIMIQGVFIIKVRRNGGMPSGMQLSFSDIVSVDADTFFIPLSLCFQSAIKVIGGSVCEYFDSMVKSDNSDLKWPLEDVKFRQDLWLSPLQIQMDWLQLSWLILIGWSTLFCFLIGKSRKSTSLSGWCLCLEDSQCEPCDNQDFSHDEIQQPFVLFLSTPYSYFSF